MRRGFLPVADAELMQWSAQLANTLVSDPESFGISSEIAQAFADVQQAFAESLPKVEPSVRTRFAVATKNDCREALKAAARRINTLLRGNGVASDAQLTSLGLTVHKTTYRKIGAPTTSPQIQVDSVAGRMITLKLNDKESVRNRLPADVAAATIYVRYGEEPIAPSDASSSGTPGTVTDWQVATHTSKARVTLDIDAPPGTKVWFAAYWLSPRNERGPWGNMAYTHAMGGIKGPSLLAA